MPPEQNSQGRRPNYPRGRRGSDRRGPERRHLPAAGQESSGREPGGRESGAREPGSREQGEVEQIMRDIRARISQRHGIELSTAQIQELAARRLEAILDPRTVKPSLLEQLRKSAATPLDAPAAPVAPPYVFEDRTIYESHNALLRFIRRILNPLLKLFFNPNPIAHALNAQAAINAERAARDAERDRRQAEWNALHYDILQRLDTEIARVSIEMQSLSTRAESLAARVDFNDRRVRSMETQAAPARPQNRHAEPRQAPPAVPIAVTATAVAAAPAPENAATGEVRPAEGTAAGDGTRRRRRRRRGRRSGAGAADAGAGEVLAGSDIDAVDGDNDADEGDDENGAPEGRSTASDPSRQVAPPPRPLPTAAITPPAADPASHATSTPVELPPAKPVEQAGPEPLAAMRQDTLPHPQDVAYGSSPEPAATAPDEEAAPVTTPLSAPKDEPGDVAVEPPAAGPLDR